MHNHFEEQENGGGYRLILCRSVKCVGSAFMVFFLATLMALKVVADNLPMPIHALKEQGAEVVESFEAPAGMEGYVLYLQGRPVTAYVAPDRQHAIIGNLVDADLNSLSSSRLEKAMSIPRDPNAWVRLYKSHWILDGDEQAARVVYVFSDANCPYCHQFWLAARPWVESGLVQLRHVMVGVIKENSIHKAATILAADNPSKALSEHENNYYKGGVVPRNFLPEAALDKVRTNNDLMHDLGYFATPTIIYRNKKGDIRQIQGLPQGEAMIEVMGKSPDSE